MPEFMAGLIVLALIGVALAWRADRSRRVATARRYAGEWKVFDRGERGDTVVGIRRVEDGRETGFIVVARVSNGDPDWLRKVREARAEAAERISTLGTDV